MLPGRLPIGKRDLCAGRRRPGRRRPRRAGRRSPLPRRSTALAWCYIADQPGHRGRSFAAGPGLAADAADAGRFVGGLWRDDVRASAGSPCPGTGSRGGLLLSRPRPLLRRHRPAGPSCPARTPPRRPDGPASRTPSWCPATCSWASPSSACCAGAAPADDDPARVDALLVGLAAAFMFWTFLIVPSMAQTDARPRCASPTRSSRSSTSVLLVLVAQLASGRRRAASPRCGCCSSASLAVVRRRLPVHAARRRAGRRSAARRWTCCSW